MPCQVIIAYKKDPGSRNRAAGVFAFFRVRTAGNGYTANPVMSLLKPVTGSILQFHSSSARSPEAEIICHLSVRKHSSKHVRYHPDYL